MDLKTDFLRGQENAQDDLNENFLAIEAFLSVMPNMSVVVGAEGQFSGSAANGKEIGVGNTITNQLADRPVGTVTATHRFKVSEGGVYLIIMQVWTQPSSSTGNDGYWYNNLLINGARFSGERRVWGFGSGNWKNRNDGTGISLVTLSAGDEVSADVETNFSGAIASAGISKLVAIKIA